MVKSPWRPLPVQCKGILRPKCLRADSSSFVSLWEMSPYFLLKFYIWLIIPGNSMRNTVSFVNRFTFGCVVFSCRSLYPVLTLGSSPGRRSHFFPSHPDAPSFLSWQPRPWRPVPCWRAAETVSSRGLCLILRHCI